MWISLLVPPYTRVHKEMLGSVLTESKRKCMRGQRGRLPVQALGYAKFAKVILGFLKTAGVLFLSCPHDTNPRLIRQFTNGGPRTEKYDLSIEAPFTGPLEKLLVFLDMDKSMWEIYFQTP